MFGFICHLGICLPHLFFVLLFLFSCLLLDCSFPCSIFLRQNGPVANYLGSSGANFALELHLVLSDLSPSSFSFADGSVLLPGSQLCSASSLQWTAALHSAKPRWFRRLSQLFFSVFCFLGGGCTLGASSVELAGGYGIALWYQQLLKVCKSSAGLFILPILAGFFFFLSKMKAGHLFLGGRDPKCGILYVKSCSDLFVPQTWWVFKENLWFLWIIQLLIDLGSGYL